MTGAFYFHPYKLLSALKSFVVLLLRTLFSWIKPSDDEGMMQTVKESPPDIDHALQIEPTEPSPIWLIIQEIIIKLCVIAVIIAFLASLIYGLYQLYKHFHAAKADEIEKKEFISPFYKDNRVKKIRKIHKAKLSHIFPNNNDKIRRYFYHVIINKYKDKVPDNLTAEELLNLPVRTNALLSSESTQKPDPMLLELYHKARYSDEMCSKEEVNMAKGIVKRMK